MDDSRQVGDLTHAKQFLWAVLTIIKFSVEIDVRFFFVQYSFILGWTYLINERIFGHWHQFC